MLLTLHDVVLVGLSASKLVAVVLMYRINWKKLFVVVAIMTTAGMVLQTYTLPYPMATWFLPPQTMVSSYKSLNGSTVHLTETLSLESAEQFQLVPTAPVVSLNSSTELVKSVPIVEERAQVSPRKNPSSRRRRKNAKIDKTNEQKVVFHPPPPRTVPTRLQRYIWSLPPDEALLFAKREIQNVSTVTDDPELYASLFHNVSVFKSARQLETALYVPNSHNIRPLSIFLRDHVNMIAAKYPFWNRTHGSDHFLVACHDWGPYTVNEHQELSRNTIKALCNADLSEGIFVKGKDVSLPETTIRNPRRPLRNVGGRRVSQRPILAFFAGNMHGRVRPTLLKYWSDKDEDMRIYGPLPNRISRKMSYIQHMKSSRFCICPMGYEVNSPRIVEAIYYECVPVIIADNFVPPLNNVLDWTAFSVIVAEKDIPKLKEILLAIPLRRYLVMQTNVKMVQKHFLWNPKPVRYDLFHMVLHSIWFSRLNQIQISVS
ncbi:probable glycosyltransferase At5g03795 isoform X3 [Vitis riparia]|uniref:probable glycosyltransferase At5g03795 isoform X3 n=1 Tax=Vitis riparia TaxID=96939 RepID=UPI00155A28B0|nr:probable glycosyltransferase At5g03795 isoform X3 [Vitis riparia]